MLRVGLTGDLGSGKSTVAAMFAARGATIFSADEIARAMMQPGETVYARIVEQFGQAVISTDGAVRSLDRRKLASLAFEAGRVEELNAIIHPAVLHEQARLLEELSLFQPHAIAVTESALIFTTQHGIEGQSWQKRFDRIVLVRAPEVQKIARFVERLGPGRTLSAQERAALEADARSRLRLQSAQNEAHAAECIVIENSGSFASLTKQVDEVWAALRQAEAATR